MMKLEVNGKQFENFISAECEIRLDALAGTFRFSAVNPNGVEMPFKGGEECRVIVDGEAVLTGDIEVVEVDYDGENHDIVIQGRSRSARLLDSSIGILDDIFTDNLTLKSLIEKVADNIGLEISVTDNAKPAPFNPAEDLAAPEPGDNAFSLIEKFVRKRNVLLHPSADGGITIATNSQTVAAGRIQHIIGANDNNVMNSRFRYDSTGRFNVYEMASQLNPIPLVVTGGSDLASLVDQRGGVFDDSIKPGRRMVIVAEAPYSDEECEARAKWELDVRKARGLVYSCTVPYFRVGGTSGDLWRINRIYQIVDDFVGKIEPMLCNSVRYQYDDETGSTTQLSFVGRNAYTNNPVDIETGEVASNVA